MAHFNFSLWHISYSISNGKSTDCHCDTTYWLKSLKDRVQPQSKQEWSALDERNLQGIIDEIEANKNHAHDCDLATYDRFLSWLKSLKDRYTWKPNEEQMLALKSAEGIVGCLTIIGGQLKSLYEDLKKLKGE